MPDIIQICNLSVHYQDAEKPAVSHVDLGIPEHSIVAVAGESGSGKSTLIRAVIGLLSGGGRVTEGDILFRGRSIVNLEETEYRKLRGKHIAMIFQDAYSAFDPRKKVGYQYVESLRSHMNISKADARNRAEDMLRKIALPDPGRILDSYPFELSGGMIQRVAIGMSMSMEADILLADEPTSALDVTVQAQVVRAMMDLCAQRGTTIILVTHNLGIASYMADYLAVMYKGRLVDFGPVNDVIEHPKDDYTRRLISSVPDMEVTAFAE